MNYSASDVESLKAIDARIVTASQGIKLLSQLSWKAAVQERFLDLEQRGRLAMPQVEYPRVDLQPHLEELTRVVSDLGSDMDPLRIYLRKTAQSYINAIRLIHSAGTKSMLEHSHALYATPADSLSGGKLTNLEAAEHFLEVVTAYEAQGVSEEPDYCLSAETVKSEIEQRLGEVFEVGKINVVIDASLASKAAAGATRIRLRAGTCFSEYDVEQLLQHEAFIHSLTALNGRAQPVFQTFALGSPRTTGPQEGLATFAELITGAMDMQRIRRLALRVVAVAKALDGADFIDVFRLFKQWGQNSLESFNSAMRVFRGAPLDGGCAFTKDTVYLHGLMEVHTFFRWALTHEQLPLVKHFFAGRMTIGDAVRLAPVFETDYLAGPRYLPPWMARTNGLAAYLAFSVFANKIHIEALHEGHQFDRVDELS